MGLRTQMTAMGIGILAIIGLLLFYSYKQLYIQDSATTATKGILFQQTIQLASYKLISNGNGVLGSYVNYSRSDRHNEMVRIYCRDYCKQ